MKINRLKENLALIQKVKPLISSIVQLSPMENIKENIAINQNIRLEYSSKSQLASIQNIPSHIQRNVEKLLSTAPTTEKLTKKLAATISPGKKINKLTDLLPTGSASTAANILLSHLTQDTDFTNTLKRHVAKRNQEFNISSNPCLLFLTYRDQAQLKCAVSLSGHDSTASEEFMRDFYQYLGNLVVTFNTLNLELQQHEQSRIELFQARGIANTGDMPEFEYVDYESKNYSDFIDAYNYARDHSQSDSPHKPCAEKKLFAYLSKKFSADPNLHLEIDGFCATKLLSIPYLKSPNHKDLKRKKKRHSIFSFGSKRRDYYHTLRWEIIPPCATCKKNLVSYLGSLVAAQEIAHDYAKQQKESTSCPSTPSRRSENQPPFTPPRKPRICLRPHR